MEILQTSRVAVFGVGGVGGAVAEALARSGVGTLDLVDKDAVSVTNLNRQLIALTSTVGRLKVEAAAQRIRDINPAAEVHTYPVFYTPETAGTFDFAEYDYVVDAVDTVSAKIDLVLRAGQAGVPIISAMGAGNKLDPSGFEIADIYKTSVCPLARVMRRELKARGVRHLTVVYSKEEPHTPKKPLRDPETGKMIPGSIAFVPLAAGLIIASRVVADLVKNGENSFPEKMFPGMDCADEK